MENSLKWSDAAPVVAQASGENTILVGGQSINVWALILGVQLTSPELTRDIDFVGSLRDAISASNRITLPNKLYAGSMDDVSVNAAVVAVTFPGRTESTPVDFLHCLYGVENKDLINNAVTVNMEGAGRFKIIHPVILMEAKMSNLLGIKSKRNEYGVAQAESSILILRAFLEAGIRAGYEARPLLNMLERVIRFSMSKASQFVRKEYGLNTMDAIPVDALSGIQDPRIRTFIDRRLPAAVRQVEARRGGLVS